MRTTATMMFGVGESFDQRINHFEVVRRLQEETGGFTAFIPWSFQPKNTALGGRGWDEATSVEYLKVLAISRLYLDNIENVQASWVTQGLKVLELGLHFGGNDVGIGDARRKRGEGRRHLELHHGRRAAPHHPRRGLQARAAGYAVSHDVFELIRLQCLPMDSNPLIQPQGPKASACGSDLRPERALCFYLQSKNCNGS